MTAEVRQELGHEQKDDGVFYMDMDAFFATYRSIDVSAYADWKQTMTQHTWDRSSYDASFTIENPVQQDVVVMVDMVE
jgi:hypothetical protein